MIVQKKWVEPLLIWRMCLAPTVASIFLIITAQYSYQVFHTLAELIAIVISFVIFAVAWFTYDYSKNNFLLFLACGYVWIGSLDLIHTFVYEGMIVFVEGSSNLAVQFWISARYLEALLLLAAPFAATRVQNKNLLVCVFGILAVSLATLILSGNAPVGFVEGKGLTSFKIFSEYLIILILALALVVLLRHLRDISPEEKVFISISIVMTMCAELAFTFYVSVYGLSNLAGHILKLFSYWFILQAIVVSNLKKPYTLLEDSERRSRAILDQSFQFIGLLSVDGNLIDANRTSLEFAGIEASDVIGKPFWETPWWAHSKEEQNRLKAGVGRATLGEFVRFETSHSGADGAIRIVDFSLKPVRNSAGDVELLIPEGRDITERKAGEEALKRRTHDLGERMKELTGLYSISEIFQRSSSSIEETLDEIVEIIPPGWQYPEITRARIILGDVEITSKNFRETVWRQASNITLEEKRVGIVEVFYLEEKPEMDDGPFLNEERLLIDEIAVKIGQRIEQKRLEEYLNKLSAAVEQSSTAVIITDDEGVIEYVNPMFTAINGYSLKEAVGHTPRILKSGEMPESIYKELWNNLKAGKEWTGTLRNKRKNGEVYLSGAHISPIRDAKGTITHYLGATQDITQRVEVENRLKQAEKMESIGGLAGGIAHDFNNLLLPILVLANKTRDEFAEKSRERVRLDKVIEAATQAKGLVAKILSFSHKEDVNQENIDLQVAIRETLELLRSTLPTSVKIVENIKSDTMTVFADQGQLSSMLMNLATNAADAMDGKPGEVNLSLSLVKIGKKKAASIHGLKTGKYARLTVKDSGHGMDEKTLARIMDPFFTTKPVGKGTGLGLFMVQGIVTKHGGALHIVTKSGKGTTVEVYLPLVDGGAIL